MPAPSKMLREGMRAKDLRDLVLPMVSVDEYESKISPDSVVIGFYVQDRQAAIDLNRFIQKAPAKILDTEVSPAPDRHGYYLVFVEVPFDTHIGTTMSEVIKDVSSLADVDEWKISVRHHRGLVPFRSASVYKMIASARGNLQEDAVADFLSESELPLARVAHSTLILQSGPTFRIEGLRERAHMRRLAESPADLDFATVTATTRLGRSLGPGWDVDAFSDGLWVVSNKNDPRCLVLKSR